MTFAGSRLRISLVAATDIVPALDSGGFTCAGESTTEDLAWLSAVGCWPRCSSLTGASMWAAILAILSVNHLAVMSDSMAGTAGL